VEPGGYVDDDGDRVPGIFGADGSSIGACEPWENAYDNARLIAAAPDLLAALEEMTGWFGTDNGLRGGIGRARAAIAKAKGSEPVAPQGVD
jgi:hypothetical protein